MKDPVLGDLSLLSPLITGEDSLEGYSFPQIQSGETRLLAGGAALPSGYFCCVLRTEDSLWATVGST